MVPASPWIIMYNGVIHPTRLVRNATPITNDCNSRQAASHCINLPFAIGPVVNTTFPSNQPKFSEAACAQTAAYQELKVIKHLYLQLQLHKGLGVVAQQGLKLGAWQASTQPAQADVVLEGRWELES